MKRREFLMMAAGAALTVPVLAQPVKPSGKDLEQKTLEVIEEFKRRSPAGQQRSLKRFDSAIENETDAEIRDILVAIKDYLSGITK